MEDTTIKVCVLAICGTIAYVAYTIVNQADGLIFGGFCTFLGGLGGYVIAKR